VSIRTPKRPQEQGHRCPRPSKRARDNPPRSSRGSSSSKSGHRFVLQPRIYSNQHLSFRCNKIFERQPWITLVIFFQGRPARRQGGFQAFAISQPASALFLGMRLVLSFQNSAMLVRVTKRVGVGRSCVQAHVWRKSILSATRRAQSSYPCVKTNPFQRPWVTLSPLIPTLASGVFTPGPALDTDVPFTSNGESSST
jgi:hypothetical protein